MQETTIALHPDFGVGPVDLRIFGGFLEHLGRAVYQGVYDPESRHADEAGLRRDVLEALRRLRMTILRYPGGNFVSGYHWLDGVGPPAARPAVRDLAWQSREPNRFGTDECLGLCRKLDWAPMFTVNLGTGTPEEARNWVEYCNGPAGTRYADLRAANGHAEPYGVRLWCLGNEMDGSWQIGHVPADQYAIRARQAAKMMKDTDPKIEVVACGSSGMDMPTFLEWDRQVLDYLGDAADYISLHRYVGNRRNDTPDYLAVGASIDRQIEAVDALCRFSHARRRGRKRAYLCFDEWNVWYRNQNGDGRGAFAPPLLEEVYNLEDALVVGQFLCSFLRHADVLKVANLAQIVNVIAPVMTHGDELLIQTIFHVFEMFSRRRSGVALRAALRGPNYESPSYGVVPAVDTAAVLDGAHLHLFAVNRLAEPARVRVDLAGAKLGEPVSAEILTGPAKAANTFEQPRTVCPQRFDEFLPLLGGMNFELPALSVVAATLTRE